MGIKFTMSASICRVDKFERMLDLQSPTLPSRMLLVIRRQTWHPFRTRGRRVLAITYTLPVLQYVCECPWTLSKVEVQQVPAE